LHNILDKRYGEWTEKSVNDAIEDMMNVEKFVLPFLDECNSEILKEKPKLVGFTTTFHQNCASLSLAKTIKNKANIPIIFGGANCEGEMGASLLKIAPWVDFVCSGEGNISFIEFVKTFISNGHTVRKINGILTHESKMLDIALTSPVMDMDTIPYPDYDDYFSACSSSLIRNELDPGLVIETSRGCWWGEKFQCTFCGLNGSTMKYTSKSVTRALEELEYLTSKYQKKRIHVVDNILDLKYIDDLFPKIYDRKTEVELFYETKSNISKRQLSIMKRGVQNIQPGIESLSDKILAIMKKGVSALQNIQLLKWCYFLVL
jgi:ribosomal peptide maturation radical SAM protein 1